MIIYKGDNIIIHADEDLEKNPIYSLMFIQHDVCLYVSEQTFDELTTKLPKQINKRTKKGNKNVRRNT